MKAHISFVVVVVIIIVRIIEMYLPPLNQDLKFHYPLDFFFEAIKYIVS